MSDGPLEDHLLRIAFDPDLRQGVYEHLREYCHQCRNRLNSLKLSIYLASRQAAMPGDPAWAEIERHYADLETRVEQVQFLCRPITLRRVTLGLDLLIDDRREAWSGLMAAAGKTLEVVPPAERAVASFDVDGLGKAIDSVVAWRAEERSTSPSASVRWWVDADRAHIRWEEAEPSHRAREAPMPRTPAPDWTLPMLARVVLAHGGDYQIRADRGWRLEISWPSPPTSP